MDFISPAVSAILFAVETGSQLSELRDDLQWRSDMIKANVAILARLGKVADERRNNPSTSKEERDAMALLLHLTTKALTQVMMNSASILGNKHSRWRPRAT